MYKILYFSYGNWWQIFISKEVIIDILLWKVLMNKNHENEKIFSIENKNKEQSYFIINIKYQNWYDLCSISLVYIYSVTYFIKELKHNNKEVANMRY